MAVQPSFYKNEMVLCFESCSIHSAAPKKSSTKAAMCQLAIFLMQIQDYQRYEAAQLYKPILYPGFNVKILLIKKKLVIIIFTFIIYPYYSFFLQFLIFSICILQFICAVITFTQFKCSVVSITNPSEREHLYIILLYSAWWDIWCLMIVL